MTRFKNRNNFAFTDLLLNLVVAITFLFILTFILINPVAKNSIIEPKTKFLVIVDWDYESTADIDIWLKDNKNNLISFLNKDSGLIYLDRDDLGQINDTFWDETTKTNKIVKINREVISIKSDDPRSYVINLHWYGYKTNQPVRATIELIQIDPYKIFKKQEVVLEKVGQEVKGLQFSINDDGKIENIKRSEELIVIFSNRRNTVGGP